MKILRVLLSLILGIFLVVFPVLAQELPQPVGYVNDFAGMFSFSFRQSLEQELVAFEKETTAEIAVVTIDSLEGGNLEDYAVRLFEDWQIGKKDKDNGLLLLIAEKEREIRIEVGYGLEPVITDGRAGRIIREQMQPAFREGNYEEGVRLAVSQIEEYIQGDESASGVEGAVEEAKTIFPFLFIIFFMFVYFASFLGRTKEFWTGGIMGGIFGAFLGIIFGSFWTLFGLALGLGLLGLFLDFILSKNYKKLKQAGKSTGFWGSMGGFSSGGRSGGFGGFGGGRSGGGGASGGW